MTSMHAEIESMLPYVHRLIATRYYNLPRHVAEHDDLVQVAMLAITEAAPRFDPDRGATFVTFAYTRARGAIQDHIRSQVFGGRHHHDEYTVVRFDAPVARGDTDTWAEKLPDPREYDDPIQRDLILKHANRPLNERGREAFRLVILEDQPAREVADIVGVTESRVSQWLRQAREAVEPLLAEAA